MACSTIGHGEFEENEGTNDEVDLELEGMFDSDFLASKADDLESEHEKIDSEPENENEEKQSESEEEQQRARAGREQTGNQNHKISTEQGVNKLSNALDEPNLSDDASVDDSDSEGEDSKRKFPQFRANTDMKDPEFSIGLEFGTKKEFKEAIENYAFKNGKQLGTERDDKNRVQVKCKHAFCPWFISVRKMKYSGSWMVTRFKNIHDGCGWVYKNKMVTSTKVAKRWKAEIEDHHGWKMKHFKKKDSKEEGFHLSKWQAWRALKKAKQQIRGTAEANFKKIWSYLAEIKRTNPNSTCELKLSDLEEMNGQKRFFRFYMCWDASREGFKYCRPIIGLDGTHLKTETGGVLLTAIGIDANDSIFPIAYALVEGETKDPWSWFLKWLAKDLEIVEPVQKLYTFMSDKQKGLLPAFDSVLPHVEHRFCVRHLHGNMKVAGFHGKALKDALWTCARAATRNSYSIGLQKLRDLDNEAYAWLSDKDPSEWSRSHFSSNCKSDMLVNNICESFNNGILEAREEPIMTCLESIRKLLMSASHVNML